MYSSHLIQRSCRPSLFRPYRPPPTSTQPPLSLAAYVPRRPFASLRPGYKPLHDNAFRGVRFSSCATLAGIGIALSFYQPSSTIHCEAVPAAEGPAPQLQPAPLPPPPPSSVNPYELTFGTVCGICAGVFVKKGAKLLAFAFGGIFVLLQYLGSQSLVKVDWARMGQKFERLAYTKDAHGHTRAPTVGSLLRWFVDFLTADFQQRASFVAGFALGLRLG